MTVPSDIYVILLGERTAAPPRQVLRAALASKAPTIVVVAPGDDPAIAGGLAAMVRGANVAFSSSGGRLGPGAGSFAVRRDALTGLEITEDWALVGYEIAAQVAAAGGPIVTGDGPGAGATPARPAPARAAAVKLRWSRPVVRRRQRLARRRTPEAW